MIDRTIFWTCEGLGWFFCELAFKTDCRGPFAWAYRAGCWLYGKAMDASRSGELVSNPKYRPGGDESFYVMKHFRSN